jgi:hypothetical protein
MKKIDKYFLILLIILIINHKYNINIYDSNNYNTKSILNKKQSELFELTELSIMIYLIIYSIFNCEYVNGFMFTVAFIQHILQLLYCYRYENQNKKISTIIIYIVLVIYNIINKKVIFTILWLFVIMIHLLSYYYNRKFMEVICLSNYININ